MPVASRAHSSRLFSASSTRVSVGKDKDMTTAFKDVQSCSNRFSAPVIVYFV